MVKVEPASLDSGRTSAALDPEVALALDTIRPKQDELLVRTPADGSPTPAAVTPEG
jgi:hypothetical protein